MNSILKLPYDICLFLFNLTCKLVLNAEVWPRHSYLLPYFEPTKSDLDISVFLNRPGSRKAFTVIYRIFKLFFPFLGEYNIYDADNIAFFRKYQANPFEISRDPLLIEKFLPEYKEADYKKNQALVFLQRLFVSDYHNLKDSRNIRLEKWRAYFGQIDRELFVKRKILKAPLDLIPYNVSRSVATAVIYLTNITDHRTAELERLNFMFSVELSLFYKNYPWSDHLLEHMPLLSVYFPEYVCAYRESFPPPAPDLLLIMLEEIDWLMMNNLRRTSTKKLVEKSLEDFRAFTKVVEHLQREIPLERLQEKLRKLHEATTLMEAYLQRF